MGLTTDPNDPGLQKTKADGQHEKYIVLSEEERQKGFVRPVRQSYKHVGLPLPATLRDLTPDEHERYDQYGYVKYEEYVPHRGAVTGKFWTQAELDRATKQCGVVTKMRLAIAETYARDPKFYGATFCCGCGRHLPVQEFVWEGTDERVGS